MDNIRKLFKPYAKSRKTTAPKTVGHGSNGRYIGFQHGVDVFIRFIDRGQAICYLDISVPTGMLVLYIIMRFNYLMSHFSRTLTKRFIFAPEYFFY